MPDSPEPRGAVPPGYKEALYWKLTNNTRRIVLLNLLSIPLAALFCYGYFHFVNIFGGMRAFELNSAETMGGVLGLLLGLAITIALHELAHGVAMQAFGARPEYGVMWKALAFYATTPGYAFTRRQYLIILLAPLVSLTLISLLAIVVLAGNPIVLLVALWGIVNGGSACGDLWIAGVALRYPESAYIIDERDGMRIFVPAETDLPAPAEGSTPSG
jgi:hypothetical protein